MKDFKSFTEELKAVEERVAELKDTLNQLCNFLSNVTLEDIDGVDLGEYNPFSKCSRETLRCYTVNDKSVSVYLDYHDSYDDFESNTTVEIPYRLVDLYLSGNLEAVEKEVITLSRTVKTRRDKTELQRLKLLAESAGYNLVKV